MRELPFGFDAFTWLAFAVFLLSGIALRSIWTSRVHAARVKLIWSAVALVPVAGALAWFVLGRERRRRM